MPAEPYAIESLIKAAEKRAALSQQTEAYRLCNGFYEGLPGLVFDRYGPALVILDHTEPGTSDEVVDAAAQWGMAALEDVETVLHKQRSHPEENFRRGVCLAGGYLPKQISELGVLYALDLQLHQDASFYLDTRNLRRWLRENMAGKRVLNTFCYTGSLGIAAGVGGAAQVVQTDLNAKYLRLARQSWALNQLPTAVCQTVPGDFFRVVGRMRSQGLLFDCVILDPPFFSATEAGRVDLLGETTRLINKVRPLVAHEGHLVVINNALFLSGADFMAELDALCQSPYIELETTLPVPPDVTGYPETVITPPPTDPKPFNHPTKIAILKMMRKDGRQ
ncbi:MAG: class I SAM-dependent methyltransferase [Brevefilum sp.]